VRIVAVLLLVLGLGGACGDVASVRPDASSDAGPLAASPPGPIELTLLDPFANPAGPVAGAGVLVLRPEGEVVGETETNEEGAARIEDVPPGSVLVVLLPQVGPAGTGGSRSIAVFDVQPGDQIAFRPNGIPDEVLPAMQVQLPVDAGAAIYVVSNGCGLGTSVEEIVVTGAFRERCVINDDVDLLAWTLDESGNVRSFLSARRPYVANGSLDLSALAWQASSPAEVAVSDIPPEAAQVELNADLLAGQRTFGPLASRMTAVDNIFLVPAPASDFGDSFLFGVRVLPHQAAFAPQQVELRAMHGASTALALGDELLPWYSSAVYGPDQQVLRWSRTAGREPDAQYLVFEWIEKGTGAYGAWFVAAPPGWLEASLPRLPDEHAARLPVSPEAFNLQVFAGEANTLDGWPAARQRGFDLMHDGFLLGEAPGTVFHRARSRGGGLL
jgi:hypothetical protein